MTLPLSHAPTLHELLRRATDAFAHRFGRAPSLAAAAPGRINLIGEHTDYSGGFVMPIAIDRLCVAVAAPAADLTTSRLFAVDLGETAEIDWRHAISVHPKGASAAIDQPHRSVVQGAWPSYIAGVAAAFGARPSTPPAPNLDLAVTSSVPYGGGLSSSAAVEVAVATIIEQVLGERMGLTEKALLCQRAEHDYAGVPCGIMDQLISVMGRADHALLIDCRSQEATAIPVPGPDRAAVLAINTNVHHALASGEYAQRRRTCEAAAQKLGVAELRNATPGLLREKWGALTPIEQRRARHVVTENERVLSAAAALSRGDLGETGRLMRESHASLRDDHEVSCPELDTLVELALAQPGVYGARMTGGGFGGCIVALASPDAVDRVVAAVSAGYRDRHGRDCAVYLTRASDGARPLPIPGRG